MVNSIIASSLSYSFYIYKWPTNMLKEVDRGIRYFIWIRDVNQQCLIIIKWNHLCSSKLASDLQVMNIHGNKNYFLRLAWDFSYSLISWAMLMRSRFLKTKYNKFVLYKSSPVRPNINEWYDIILDSTRWILANGEKIKFGMIIGIIISISPILLGFLE